MTNSIQAAAAEAALLELVRRKVWENGRTLTAAEIKSELRSKALQDYETAAVLKLEARGVLIPKEPALPTGTSPSDAIKRSFLQRSGPPLWLIGAKIVEEPATPPTAPPPRKRNRVSKEEAEGRIRDWLEKHAKVNPASITRDAVADGTGLGTGSVSNSSAWKAFRDRRNSEAKPGPRNVPLSDQFAASISSGIVGKAGSEQRDALLNELVRKQEAEAAEESLRHERRQEPS